MALNNQDLDMARLHPDVLSNRKAKGYIGTIIAALRRLLVALGGKYVSSDDTDVVLVEKIADLAENGGINPSVLIGGGGNSQNIWYATCTTATGTADKVATSTTGDFVLATGNMCVVNFTYYNNQTQPYLSIDGCTKKRIKERSGTGNITTALWRDSESVMVVYDGTDFIVLEGGTASTSYYGVTKLSNSISSTSQAVAATPKAVKTAYDLAAAAYSPSNPPPNAGFGTLASIGFPYTATGDGIMSVSATSASSSATTYLTIRDTTTTEYVFSHISTGGLLIAGCFPVVSSHEYSVTYSSNVDVLSATFYPLK